ncbi:hypothetical protein C6A87_010575 [Mycobacterium sp. ITM-2016-00317]|uniref:hypothetical protein n=1 Tax=Mycobacterium sp. ITM-2016-00317 TaxID=2099694 RepID=UPI000D489A05|nr:hypothetical protein [Mycobacterium sp. ITM-2016-00317]WNG89556.1 hypothetical protein C6A87_010575 [Mycobacterium sp. ITM-2016-00317]
MASRRFRSVSGAGAGPARHGVVVLACGVAPVVAAVGGFLCDRARGGWDVRVLVSGPVDTRALAILGVSAHPEPADVETFLDGIAAGTTVAVQDRMLDADASIRHRLRRVAARPGVTVAVWGEGSPAGPATIAHRPSAAAEAFKTHALRAASATDSGGAGVEVLHPLHAGAYRRLSIV